MQIRLLKVGLKEICIKKYLLKHLYYIAGISVEDNNPMEGFYKNAHFVVVNSKIYPNSFAYFLEIREIGDLFWTFQVRSHSWNLQNNCNV